MSSLCKSETITRLKDWANAKEYFAHGCPRSAPQNIPWGSWGIGWSLNECHPSMIKLYHWLGGVAWNEVRWVGVGWDGVSWRELSGAHWCSMSLSKTPATEEKRAITMTKKLSMVINWPSMAIYIATKSFYWLSIAIRRLSSYEWPWLFPTVARRPWEDGQ